MKIDISKNLNSIPIESQELLHDTLAVLMELEYQDGILPALLKAIDSEENTLEMEFHDLPRAIDQILYIGEYHKKPCETQQARRRFGRLKLLCAVLPSQKSFPSSWEKG